MRLVSARRGEAIAEASTEAIDLSKSRWMIEEVATNAAQVVQRA